MKYELTQEQVNNLLVLLERVQLTWKEVKAYVEIINIFNNPIKEEKTNNT